MVADGNRRGYSHLLEGFWDEAQSFGLPLPTEEPVAAASFCTARPKITSELLRHMLHELATNAFEDSTAEHRWHGRRVFAVDGAKINLQRSPDLHSHFGTPSGAHCPQVLVSVLLDVCAKLPVDLVVAPFASSEREHLLEMLPSLGPGDVLTLDRGYPSHEVLQELVESKIDFLVRVPSASTFGVVDRMRAEDLDDLACLIHPPQGDAAHWRPLELRAVRIQAPDGSESFFLTTLASSNFTRADIAELYHLRWEVEEHFKLLQGNYLGQGQFRSKGQASRGSPQIGGVAGWGGQAASTLTPGGMLPAKRPRCLGLGLEMGERICRVAPSTR